MGNSFNTYIHRSSFMHRLNPSLKIIGMVFLIVCVFLPLGFFGQMILLLITTTLWLGSKLPRRLMRNILKSTIAMFVILFIINWLIYKTPGMVGDINEYPTLFNLWGGWVHPTLDGSTPFNDMNSISGLLWGGSCSQPVWFSGDDFNYLLHDHSQLDWNLFYKNMLDEYDKYIFQAVNGGYVVIFYHADWYALSSQVIIYSLYVTLKIYLMITIVTLMVSTTNAIQISFAIEDILTPLKYLKIPINEWAMTISIALRFVPSLLQESQIIMRAQASRGVDFSNGNFKDKMKSLVSLVVPMFSIAFHKADDLANAMEARSYNPRYARTRYRSYSIHRLDWLIFGLLTALLGLMIFFTVQNVYFAPFGWPEAILMFGG